MLSSALPLLFLVLAAVCAVPLPPGHSPICHTPPPTLSEATRKFVLHDSTTTPLALTGVRIIDPATRTTQDNCTIVLQGGYVQDVGPSDKVRVPAGAKVLPLDSMSVVPGLVGMHEHLFYPAKDVMYSSQIMSFPLLYLSRGVTTIRTGGSMHGYADLNMRDSIDAGAYPGPRILPTAPYVEGAASPFWQMKHLKDVKETVQHVNYWADQGVEGYKLYNYVSLDQVKAAVNTAHSRGKKVTAHLCSVTFRDAVLAGIDNLEHGIIVASDFLPSKQRDVCPPSGEIARKLITLDMRGPDVLSLIDLMVSRNVALTSTLAVLETFAPGRPQRIDERVLATMLPEARAMYLAQRAAIEKRNDTTPLLTLKKEMEFERVFVERGGLLMAGVDPTGYGGAIAGFGDLRNLELLVEAGFSPIEALRIHTHNAAKYLNVPCIGNLRIGARADLMVVRGDPVSDIRDINAVELVMKDGVAYDPQRLFEATVGEVAWV